MDWNQSAFSAEQETLIRAEVRGSCFVHGPAGAGKTSAAAARLRFLLDSGVPAHQILILVPQRSLAAPYYAVLQDPDLPPGSVTGVVTLGGLAQRMISLFWPVIAQASGFHKPNQPPAFLTLETAQYTLSRLVEPLIQERGYFEGVSIDRNRLVSQILDNLNKAALVGFPMEKVGERLKAALKTDPAQSYIFEQAQECANLFRQYCLENNLLDFSLQLEVFTHRLWPSLLVQEYLKNTYRHLVYDNIEEDVPVAHDILSQWLPEFDSALLVYDTDGGYRSFLGADPESSRSLGQMCETSLALTSSFVTPVAVESARVALESAILKKNREGLSPDIRKALHFEHSRFSPQMIETVCSRIAMHIEQGIPPGEIAVLSPFLSDSLRFALTDRLNSLSIPSRSNRPSRSLRDEPAARCLLTLARIAYPQWQLAVNSYDVRYMLMQVIEGCDLVRADLLTRIIHRKNNVALSSFTAILPGVQERITYTIGERYEILRSWLLEAQQNEPLELDVFLSRLFGEVLSQPGFGFHQNFPSAGVAARLIESIRKFRRGVSSRLEAGVSSGKEYIEMVSSGVIAAQYLPTWEEIEEDAVYIAPAHTFLMANHPVLVQFWLDIGSLGWWQRLYQPLTHPVVLSRRWLPGMEWTDVQEFEQNTQNLARLAGGLLRRCSGEVYLCATSLNEQGDEPRGALLQAAQSVLRRLSLQVENEPV